MGITRENLTGVRVVRAFGKEHSETERFETANGLLNSMQLHVGRLSGLMNPLTYVVVNLATIAILNMGASRINHGMLLSGDVVALVNYMSQILIELVKLANTVVLLSKALASLNRIEGVLETASSMKFTEGNGSLKNRNNITKSRNRIPENQNTAFHMEEAVEFQQVSLTYAGAGEESLTDISFCAQKGRQSA